MKNRMGGSSRDSKWNSGCIICYSGEARINGKITEKFAE